MEQSDRNCYTGPVKAIVPHVDSIKTIQIVSGVFPAVAVESAVPSVTEWVSQDEILSCVKFADLLLEKHADHAVELLNGDLLPVTVRGCVLKKFGYFPRSSLDELRVRLDGEIAEAKQSVDEHVKCFVQELYNATVGYSQLLIAIPCPPRRFRVSISSSTLRPSVGTAEQI
uniref:Uncharacterized protein n=1 Tax=Hyaloperonospora arabidopsidis (strain Emoy2) TaxID=559515 RepID=M4BB86_HYAAE